MQPPPHRLIGAVLAEIHEQWQERKYFDIAEYHEWSLERKPNSLTILPALNKRKLDSTEPNLQKILDLTGTAHINVKMYAKAAIR